MQQKSSSHVKILASQKTRGGRGEEGGEAEEVGGGGGGGGRDTEVGQNFFLPSFFYSKSQLLYQALQGSCSVYINIMARAAKSRAALGEQRFVSLLLMPWLSVLWPSGWVDKTVAGSDAQAIDP